MRQLGVGMVLAALLAGTAGAERFGVQLGVGAGAGGVGVQAGAYARVAGFGPAQLEARGTFEQALSGSGGTRVGADALVSVNLLLLRPYAGLGLTLPLGKLAGQAGVPPTVWALTISLGAGLILALARVMTGHRSAPSGSGSCAALECPPW